MFFLCILTKAASSAHLTSLCFCASEVSSGSPTPHAEQLSDQSIHSQLIRFNLLTRECTCVCVILLHRIRVSPAGAVSRPICHLCTRWYKGPWEMQSGGLPPSFLCVWRLQSVNMSLLITITEGKTHTLPFPRCDSSFHINIHSGFTRVNPGL